jgi:hypothetical protein
VDALRFVRIGAEMKINYAAVAVSGILYWILGAVWFGFLFGNQWMALEHITSEQARGMEMPWVPYVVSFLLDLLIAFVIAVVCAWRTANTASRGAALGILMWIGFAGPVMYTSYIYEMRPNALFAINGFYPLVGFCLMGAILGAWTKKA